MCWFCNILSVVIQLLSSWIFNCCPSETNVTLKDTTDINKEIVQSYNNYYVSHKMLSIIIHTHEQYMR